MEELGMGPNSRLLIGSKTWERDSHGLFDYESLTVTTQELTVSHPGKLVMQDSNMHFITEHPEPELSANPLAEITFLENKFYFGKLQEDLWRVIKYTDPTGYHVHAGDILKFGRIPFKVKEMCNHIGEFTTIDEGVAREAIGIYSACRICQQDDFDEENPLVSPCGCTGSMKFIHLECLRGWLNTHKIVKESENSVTAIWRVTRCEICHKKYSYFVKVMGKTLRVFLEECKKPMLILDALSEEDPTGEALIGIFLNNSLKTTIGRGNAAEIKIVDITVSRLHASLYYSHEEKAFFIKDEESKFGTLVKVQEPLELAPKQEVSLQIKRTLLFLSFIE